MGFPWHRTKWGAFFRISVEAIISKLFRNRCLFVCKMLCVCTVFCVCALRTLRALKCTHPFLFIICCCFVNNFIVSRVSLLNFSSELWTCSRVHEKCEHLALQKFLLHRWLLTKVVWVCLAQMFTQYNTFRPWLLPLPLPNGLCAAFPSIFVFMALILYCFHSFSLSFCAAWCTLYACMICFVFLPIWPKQSEVFISIYGLKFPLTSGLFLWYVLKSISL